MLTICADKKLLMTSLQFLNNLVAQNERRKLNLWVELFDSPADANYPGPMIERGMLDSAREFAEGEPTGSPDVLDEELQDGLPDVIRKFKDGLMAHLNRLDERRPPGIFPAREPTLAKYHARDSPFLLFMGKVGMEIQKELIDSGREAGPAEITAECQDRWLSMSKEQQLVNLSCFFTLWTAH
jgi:palmitoyltransferase